MKKSDEPVVVEQIFSATSDLVWKSITDIDQMRQWYFENIPAFKPEVGFETQFSVQSGGRDFLHMWKVTQVVLLKMVEYSWKYQEYPGHALVVFELFEQQNETKLRLTNRVLESFPEDIPEFSRQNCIDGWTFFIGKRLREFLERKC